MTTRTISFVEPVSHDEAAALIIDALRRSLDSTPSSKSAALHDLNLGDVIRLHLDSDYSSRTGPRQAGSYTYDLKSGTGAFYEAAWDLCSRGILRPTVVSPDHPASSHLAGHLFTITSFGRDWLKQAGAMLAVPSEYGRFGSLLGAFAADYGGAYLIRSQEALRCYRAQCYLACCVMCGAAAEAILVALAVRRVGDENAVLREYQRARGREWILNQLRSGQNSEVHRQLELFGDLLKYWRDTASHGSETEIHEAEAFTALLLLLRFAQFASDKRDVLAAPTVPG